MCAFTATAASVPGTEAGKIVIAPPDFDDYLHHRSTADPIGRFSPC